MKKSELISVVLSAVAKETEIAVDDILSQCKRREVVDARHIAIYLLSKYGVYYSNIAKIFKLTPRNVYYIISNFNTRLQYSPPMRSDYEKTAKVMGNNLESPAK